MDIKIRVVENNPTHTRLVVFMNGANCGTLTMLSVEAFAFTTALEKGASNVTIEREINGI